MKKFESLKWWHKLLLSLVLVLVIMSIFIIPLYTGIDIITPIFFFGIMIMILKITKFGWNKFKGLSNKGIEDTKDLK